MKLRASIALCLVAALALGCGAEGRAARRARGEVILNCADSPRSLDPGLMTDSFSQRAAMSFIRGLTILDPQGRAQPDLADRWEVSPDGRTYDFHIRPSKWTNGEAVTADDFVYAWVDRMLNPKFKAEYAYILFYLEGAKDYYEGRLKDRAKVGVEAVAPDHLRVRLAQPAPFFPGMAALFAYYPVCRSADRANPKWALRAESYVGNGPFRMTAYTPGGEIAGVKHDGYWNAAAVGMKKLTMRFIAEESTERLAFENGEIDGTYEVPRPDLTRLTEKDGLRLAPLTSTFYLPLNMKRPIFADVRVRRALALAVDRAAIVKNILRARERPAFSFVPSELYDVPLAPPLADARFDDARRLLADAGYPGGAGFPKLRYLYWTREINRVLAQAIQETWKRELGIEIELENQEFRAAIEKIDLGDFDLALLYWTADFADPINFLEIFSVSSGTNRAHFNDQEYDALLDRARAEPDPKLRMEKLRAAEQRLMDQLPIVPLYHATMPYLSAPELEGYDVTPMQSVDVSLLRWK